MIAEAHEIREKQSAHRAHVINNVAIKNQNQADDSVMSPNKTYIVMHEFTSFFRVFNVIMTSFYLRISRTKKTVVVL